MNKIKYAYFDLDGTLVNSNGEISKETINSINYLKQKGVKIGLISGRSYFAMQKEIDDIKPNLPIIAANGATVLSTTKKIIDETFMSYDSWKVIDILIKFGFSFVVYGNHGIYTNTENNYYYRKLYDRLSSYPEKYRTFECEPIKSIEWLKRIKTYKILVYIDSIYEKELIMDQLKEIYDIEIVSSNSNLIDIGPKNVTKGSVLNRISIATEMPLSETIVFGDNENDLSMFEIVSHSVCLLNAPNNVKENSSFITEKTCDENGVADFIYKHF